MMMNYVPEMIITGQLPDHRGVFSARLLDVKHRTKAIRSGNQVTIQVAIEAKADLISIESNLNLSSPDNIRLVEKAVNDRVRQMVQAAADKAQNHQADVFQWSELVKYKYPGMWKDWEESPREMMFTHTIPDFQIHVVMRSTGISRSARL
ncbi:hypothetical protein D3C85_1194730 [compost metagenome]